jgi:hypothetical protein
VISPLTTSTAASAAGSAATIPFASFASASIYRLCGGYNTSGETAGYFGLYSSNSPNVGQTTFQVPSSATKGFLGLWVEWATAGAVMTGVTVGYGTALLGSENGSTPPTGAQTYGAIGATGVGPFVSMAANTYYNTSAVGINFPPGSYPYIKSQIASAALFFCITGIVQ